MKGPLPLADKANHSIPSMTAYAPILPFPLLADRPCASMYIKVVAATTVQS